ncbi:MAG: TIR domain-containing protein [bacterium]|nr:TIR domain-containing protein [bacterium]
MARIFISYSSRDERAALGLQSWLREHAHDPILISRTKKQEQGDFNDQQADLQTSISEAEIVLLLVTPFWQASNLGQWEKKEAVSRHKPMLAILEAPTSADITDCNFVVDMTKNRDTGLGDLKDKLQQLCAGNSKATEPKPDADTSAPISNNPQTGIELQGTIIADHDRGKLSSPDRSEKLIRPAMRHAANVNRTLKVLRQGIRWSTFPGWITKSLKLPVAGIKFIPKMPWLQTFKKRYFKMPDFKPLLKRSGKWIAGDKMRMFGAAFMLFIFATVLIGVIFDRSLGGKDAMRKELANVKKRQSLFLSRVANHLGQTGDPQTAMLLALEALNEAQQPDDRLQARDALYTAYIKEQKNLVFNGHENQVSGATFSPNGKLILSSSWDRTVRVWSIAKRKAILTLDQHDGFVNGAVYSPDQSMILTAALDNKARLFNARTGKLIRTLKGHSYDLTSAAFSSNGQRIVTTSGDQTARVWEVAGGQLLKTFLGHKAGLESADFSPDGNRIATASTDKIVRILDVSSGERLALLEGHSDSVRSVRYDPQGELIATASEDKTVRLWQARSGVFVRALKGHEWAVLHASFSPDGKRLVSASKDNTAMVWDVKTGKLLQILKGHKGIVTHANFSPNGKAIITASGDGTIRLWPLFASNKDLVNKVRRATQKCLTLDQRKKYFLSKTPPKWCKKMKKPPFHK